MSALSLGEIVLLKFPYTDGNKHKKRPALVLLDTEDGDVIVCRITSKLYDSPYDFSIDDWKNCGLKLPSFIRLHKIATLEKSLIDKPIGVISKELKKNIRTKFKKIIA